MFRIDRHLLRASWEGWMSSDMRRVGPAWMAWMWTFLFCLALAAVFALLGSGTLIRSGSSPLEDPLRWLRWYGRNLIVCLTIGILIHGLFDALRHVVSQSRVDGWRPWQRTLMYSGVPMLGVLIGWPLGVSLAGGDLWSGWGRSEGRTLILASIGLSLLMTFLLHHYFGAKAREIEAQRRASEAQLRLLQAQMEPHFLFNTLATVQSLIDHDPAQAKTMLDSFTDYLRSTLSQLRRDDGTLETELTLAEHYLRLAQVRMADRLRYRIDADADLRAARLPPLLLQPLVENAVHHGLEPKVEGGTVTVTVRRSGRQLVLTVDDDGLGPDAAPRRTGTRSGNGVALANLRERLAARFPGEAAFALERVDGHTRATLTLPLIDP